MTYVPDWMAQPDRAFTLGFARSARFGTIVGTHPDEPVIAHVPIVVTGPDDAPRIEFHVAVGNPVNDLATGTRCVAVLSGPDGYISPTWYDHQNVPTWDYGMVHLAGPVEAVSRDRLRSHLYDLLAANETGLRVPDEFVDRYLDDIRGHLIRVDTVEPVFKLSQDKNAASFHGVLAGLDSRGRPGDTPLATMVRAVAAQVRDDGKDPADDQPD